MIYLDTSFIRALVSGSREDLALRRYLADEAPIAMTAVAWAEFHCGPLAEHDRSLAAAVVGEALSLTADHAARAAELFNHGGRRRGTFVDCLIAAVAVDAGASLATANPQDFAGIPGLRLV